MSGTASTPITMRGEDPCVWSSTRALNLQNRNAVMYILLFNKNLYCYFIIIIVYFNVFYDNLVTVTHFSTCCVICTVILYLRKKKNKQNMSKMKCLFILTWHGSLCPLGLYRYPKILPTCLLDRRHNRSHSM